MNRNITRRTLLIGSLCVITLDASGAQAPTQQTRQVTIIQDMAPVGLIFGQTLRYTWANRDDPDPQKRGFEPLRIRVNLLAADRSVIAQTEAAAAGAGQFQTFDFNRDLISLPGEPGSGRLQARLEVTLRGRGVSVRIIDRPGVPASDSVLKPFADAVEVIDNSSGRTTVSFSGGINEIILEGSSGKERLKPKSLQIISAGNDPIIGIVPGQSLLVSALNTANPESREQAEPVNVLVKAYDTEGNMIGEGDAVKVLPNQFRTILFNYEDLHMAGEPGTGRKQVRMRMFAIIDRTRLSPGVQPLFPPGTLSVSIETVDDNTEKTLVLTGHQPFVFFLGGIPNN